MMKAKRGDIAVIVTERRDYYIGQEDKVRTEVEVFQVTSITRDGLVKAVRGVWGSTPLPMTPHFDRRSALYIVPAAEFDVAAAMETARAHTYPHSSTPRPYGSVGEVKAMLRTHRLA